MEHRIGTKIRTLREAAGITRYRLAMTTGLQQSTIARIEELRFEPRYDNAEKILDALEYEIKVVRKEDD